MALGASWWAGGGEASRWIHDFVGYDGWTNKTSLTDWVILGIFCEKIFQAPYLLGRPGQSGRANPGFDTGYFYALLAGAGDPLPVDSVFPVGDGGTSSWKPQWQELDPVCIRGDIKPETQVGSNTWGSAYYKTPYISDRGGTYWTYSGNDTQMLMFIPKRSGNWFLYHYQPWAWNGTIPECIAACAMKSGLDTDLIDTDSFDDAHDAYNHLTGDTPWDLLNTTWEIWAQRRVGQTVADLILEMARHGRDFVYVDLQGKLATNSFTSPNNTVSGLTMSDGVIGVVKWEWTNKYLFNTYSAGWGSAYNHHGDSLPPDSTLSAFGEEPNLESYQGDKWSEDWNDATSLARIGPAWLTGRKTVVDYTGQPREVDRVHFPLLLSTHDPTPGATAKLKHIGYYIRSDSQTRRILEVKQDLRGADYGLGDLVEDVEVTSDGETIAETRCIKKKLDFRTMTVESTLMEIPSNT